MISGKLLEYIYKVGWDNYLEGLSRDVDLNAGPPPTRAYQELVGRLSQARQQRDSEVEHD